MVNMFSPELERNAFVASNGEFGWTREQIPMIVTVLSSHRLAILGGELWYVRDGSTNWTGRIPHRHGAPGIHTWETKRGPDEAWVHFMQRGVSDTLSAVGRWSEINDLPSLLPRRIFYNLCWVSEAEFAELERPDEFLKRKG
jgi:hypothetical protein